MANDSRARLIADLCQAGLSTARANAVLDEYAHSLAETIRGEISDDISYHPGEALSECEGCALVRAADLIDPKKAA